ncbi:MAG TPA: kelch repeat-containing protein [Chitinophagaceae bacterium]|nr:kelch repeat-containing protein [Chitinophagaceae bacterium]
MKKILYLITATLLFSNAIAQGDSWQQMQSLGTSANSRTDAAGFSIGSKGYIGTGSHLLLGAYLTDFWEYDPATNNWTQKADFGGGQRDQAIAFNIDNKGYIGFGFYYSLTSYYFYDLWYYEPNTNKWTLISPSYTPAKYNASAFAVNGKAYIGLGIYDYGYVASDFKEYNPGTNVWSQKATFSGGRRSGAVGFTIGNKGYIGTGLDSTYTRTKDFWEYDPATNSWTQKADFGGTARTNAIGFTIGNKGYLGTGYDGNYRNDFWEYDPISNSWTQKTDFSGGGRSGATGISIGNLGYIGFGHDINGYKNDWWQYTPTLIPTISISDTKKAEGNSGATKIKFTVKLSNPTDSIVYVSYRTFDSTAIAGADYNSKKGTLVFNPGDTQKVISVTVIGDVTPEPNEFFYVRLTDKLNAALADSVAIGTIKNDDAMPFVSESNSIKAITVSNNFKIYPNPAKDKLHINISCAENEMLNIRITDMYGREVYAKKIPVVAGSVDHTIDVTKLAKGIYTIQFISDKGVSKGKFVKE